ncbi:MAG: phosphatidylglycerophosphatase A [Methylococcus sp.]|nr:phosphatidylglycerophosphatase A [Methylococcus sp.]
MAERRIDSRVLSDPWCLIAVGFGSGLAPKAPGTFGTLAAIPVYLAFSYLPPAFYTAGVLLFFALGVPACGCCGRILGKTDHSAIVWDEVVGFLVTMWGVAASWQSLLLGFVLFRFFDIVKPWPIRVIDRRTRGGWGVMLDDVVAGAFSALILHLLVVSRTI